MAATQITDHGDRALARRWGIYSESPNIAWLIEVMAEQVQAIEDAIFQLIEDRWLDTAYGAQLDMLGGILNIDRRGTGDTQYRTRLKAAVSRYVSNGTWEDVVQGFDILANPRYVQGEEVFPAGINLTAIGVDDPVAVDIDELINALIDLKAAGVAISAAIISSDPPLVFEGDPDPAGEGLGDAHDSSVGGHFADRIF